MTCMSLSAIRQPFAFIDHSPCRTALLKPRAPTPGCRRTGHGSFPGQGLTLMSHPCRILAVHVTETAATAVGGMHMSAAATIYSPGRVLVADGVVYVRELEEPTPRSCGSSPSPTTRWRRSASACAIGARALRAANVTVDVDVIERSFSELETALRDPRDRRGRRDRPHHQRSARRGRRRARRHAHRVPRRVRPAARRHVRRRLQGQRDRQDRGARALPR